MRIILKLSVLLCLALVITTSCTEDKPKKQTPLKAEVKPKPKPKPYKTAEETISSWVIPYTISATRAPETSPVYDQIIEELNRDNSLYLKVIGHTCEIGFEYKNDKLGKERAQAIYDRLIELGVDSDRIEVETAGESNPVADNSTEEGREENRRVTFRRF
ncbi:OmpA family protein [Limibacter armeniacum]|uniref:OmpA family protein n=1 Tax=Limibacter armeniacum TaxID=466084 RepID=UPI002FE655FD